MGELEGTAEGPSMAVDVGDLNVIGINESDQGILDGLDDIIDVDRVRFLEIHEGQLKAGLADHSGIRPGEGRFGPDIGLPILKVPSIPRLERDGPPRDQKLEGPRDGRQPIRPSRGIPAQGFALWPASTAISRK